MTPPHPTLRRVLAALMLLLPLVAGWTLAVDPQESHGSGAARPREAPALPSALQARPAAGGQPVPLGAASRTAAGAETAASPLSPESRRLLRQFIVNGLLLPLIDDGDGDEGARWADPERFADCPPPSQPSVDGGPVPVGQPLTGRAFTLRWQLDGCRPFGSSGPVLSGGVEIDVYPDNEGLTAAVRFVRMEMADESGIETVAERRFAVGMPWTL